MRARPSRFAQNVCLVLKLWLLRYSLMAVGEQVQQAALGSAEGGGCVCAGPPIFRNCEIILSFLISCAPPAAAAATPCQLVPWAPAVRI